MTSKSKPKSRRDLLIGLGALAGVAGGWQLWVHRPQAFVFAPIAGVPGWRQMTFDGVTRPGSGPSGAALLGLDGSDDEPERLPLASLCPVLFPKAPAGRVPVAVFSDFYCPYCRVLIEHLGARDDPRISLHWHELPLLGPVSVVAAKAAVAADRQGA